MSAKKNRPLAIVFITMLACIGLAQPSFSATTLSLDATGPLADIASFNFTILAPDAATAADFSLTLPAGWLPLPSGDVVSAFSGGTSLPSGVFGTSDLTLTLGNWVFR